MHYILSKYALFSSLLGHYCVLIYRRLSARFLFVLCYYQCFYLPPYLHSSIVLLYYFYQLIDSLTLTFFTAVLLLYIFSCISTVF